MEQVKNGNELSETYSSLDEFTSVAAGRADDILSRDGETWERFCLVKSFRDAVRIARDGWTEEASGALELAESAVQMADQERMMDSFNQPVWDVTGAQVDVGAYLAGTPECMIDYPLTETSKVGRVITLVVSRGASSTIKAETLVKRGQVIVALALALARLGHGLEIWVDFHIKANRGKAEVQRGERTAYQRVLIKGVDDEIDPARLMFALAHPAMQRGLKFATIDGFPSEWRSKLGMDNMYGRSFPRTAQQIGLYPEGTIFLPEIVSDKDVPDADEFLHKYLGELGLLADNA